jgi:hypothetical protein
MKSYARILAPLAVAAFLAPALSLFAQSKPASSNEIVTPKVEIFLGYSRFGTFSNKVVDGNRIVNMNGGSASVAYNFNRWIGLVADVGGYDDSQLVLTGTGANQPLTVNSSGKAYTYLFGPRLSFRPDPRRRHPCQRSRRLRLHRHPRLHRPPSPGSLRRSRWWWPRLPPLPSLHPAPRPG